MLQKLTRFQTSFIKFLRLSGAFQFGCFEMKSKRVSPISVDIKGLNNGEQLLKLGRFYARAIVDRFGKDIDAVCGIAYKGTPLVTATVSAIFDLYRFHVNACYIYGSADYDGTSIIRGASLKEGSKIVIIDDVIVSGNTIENAVRTIREQVKNPRILGLMVAVDRQEIGTDRTITAVQEVSRRNMIPVEGIVTMDQALFVLNRQGDVGLDAKTYLAIKEYYAEWRPMEWEENWNPA